MQVPTETIRSNDDVHYDPNLSETFTSQDNCFAVTSHHFQIQDTATLPLPHFKRTHRKLPMHNPNTEYINQIQNNQTVTNQSNRSNDQSLMLKTITTTVLTLSEHLLAPLKNAETYSLNSTNIKPLQTITNSNANLCQTLYQPHTAPNIGPSATLLPSSSTANPNNPSVKIQNYTVSFVATNQSVLR